MGTTHSCHGALEEPHSARLIRPNHGLTVQTSQSKPPAHPVPHDWSGSPRIILSLTIRFVSAPISLATAPRDTRVSDRHSSYTRPPSFALDIERFDSLTSRHLAVSLSPHDSSPSLGSITARISTSGRACVDLGATTPRVRSHDLTKQRTFWPCKSYESIPTTVVQNTLIALHVFDCLGHRLSERSATESIAG
jgi:hypothetical protein